MEFDINLESERGEVLATAGDPQNLQIQKDGTLPDKSATILSTSGKKDMDAAALSAASHKSLRRNQRSFP